MIREARESDVEAIAHVHVTAWRETYGGIMPQDVLDSLSETQRANQFRQWFAPDRGIVESLTVCEEEGLIVGFASAMIPPGSTEADLQRLYLLREAKGHGFGRGLLVDMAGRLQGKGAQSLVLWVAVGNPAADFYEHMGGTAIETRAQQFGTVIVNATMYRWDDLGDLVRR